MSFRFDGIPAVTEQQITAALELASIIALTIKTLGSVPAGELYAHVMAHLSATEFNAVVDILVSAGIIKNENHLLTYIERR
jgi:hypothetical protein